MSNFEADGPSDETTAPQHLSQGWADDPRPPIDPMADELASLVAYLDHYRLTVEMKCADLSAEQLKARSVPPSTMSLQGLVRHLAGVERWWFQINFAGRDVEMLYYTDDQPDLDFDPTPDDPFADLAVWRAECEASRHLVAQSALGATGRRVMTGEEFTLRWLMLRMISEYAQHCGHADLLRERIDGRTGY